MCTTNMGGVGNPHVVMGAAFFSPYLSLLHFRTSDHQPSSTQSLTLLADSAFPAEVTEGEVAKLISLATEYSLSLRRAIQDTQVPMQAINPVFHPFLLRASNVS